jgi:hypothetical protein
MAVVSKKTKGRLGIKAAKGAAKRPGIVMALGKPLARRATRKKLEQVGEAVGTVLAVYGPQAAEQLGLVESPKQKRTAPRVAAGIAIGAGAVYFFEPRHGAEHRRQVLKLVS